VADRDWAKLTQLGVSPSIDALQNNQPQSKNMLRLSQRFCHRRSRGAPHEIDEVERVGRLRVAAPGDVLVRAHEHEFVAIKH
jgi:hypothetical protein